jgi:hypothetical protein
LLALPQPPASRARETFDDGGRRSWARVNLDSEVGEQIADLLSSRSRSGHHRRL